MFWRFALAMTALDDRVLRRAVRLPPAADCNVSPTCSPAQEMRLRDRPGVFDLAMKAWDLAKTAEANGAIAASFASPPTLLEGHLGAVTSAVCSPDGQRIVTASGNKTARVFRIVALSELVVLNR